MTLLRSSSHVLLPTLLVHDDHELHRVDEAQLRVVALLRHPLVRRALQVHLEVQQQIVLQDH